MRTSYLHIQEDDADPHVPMHIHPCHTYHTYKMPLPKRSTKVTPTKSTLRAKAIVQASEQMVNSYNFLMEPEYLLADLETHMATKEGEQASNFAMDVHQEKLSKDDWTRKPSLHENTVSWSSQTGSSRGVVIKLTSKLPTRMIETFVLSDGTSEGHSVITADEYDNMAR